MRKSLSTLCLLFCSWTWKKHIKRKYVVYVGTMMAMRRMIWFWKVCHKYSIFHSEQTSLYMTWNSISVSSEQAFRFPDRHMNICICRRCTLRGSEIFGIFCSYNIFKSLQPLLPKLITWVSCSTIARFPTDNNKLSGNAKVHFLFFHFNHSICDCFLLYNEMKASGKTQSIFEETVVPSTDTFRYCK